MKNSLNVFERFAQAYFKFVNGEDQRYLIRINGIVVTEVITSKDELREAYEGALAVNPKSDIEVFMVAEIDLFEDEEHEVEPDTAEETPVEESVEEVETTEDTVEEADEAPKDLPRSDKSTKKAAKKAKKSAKLAKKAKKKADKAQLDAGFAPVEDWETPAKPKAIVRSKPVVKKKVIKKTTVKKTTTAKTIGSTQSVQQIHLDTGAVIATFDSVAHAAQALGINATNISKVTNGHRKSTGGFGWKKV